jgi:hypothetical protein
VLRVCGRMQIECVNTLKELIEAENAKIVLDLSEVMLADRDAATFLAVCGLKGIALRNCPAFLREWVAKEHRKTLFALCSALLGAAALAGQQNPMPSRTTLHVAKLSLGARIEIAAVAHK